MASLPHLVKPAIGRVATGTGTGRALRGERGRRVAIDLSGTWETRPDGLRSNGGRVSVRGTLFLYRYASGRWQRVRV